MAIDETVTVIQLVNGSGVGAYQRTGLSPAQVGGRACLQCGGTERLSPFGYIEDHEGALHTYCLGRFRGEFG